MILTRLELTTRFLVGRALMLYTANVVMMKYMAKKAMMNCMESLAPTLYMGDLGKIFSLGILDMLSGDTLLGHH